MTLFTEAAERMARAACIADGCDPDELVPLGDYKDPAATWRAWEHVMNTSLTALIAFLSERGLRVVPVEATEGMVTAAIASIGQDQDDPSVRAEYREIIRQGNSAGPNVWGE